MKIPRHVPSFVALGRNWPAGFRLPQPRRWATWRNARRAAATIATLVTVTVLFYAVEDWRGRRAWSAMQEDAAARGIATTRAELQPPVIPEAENAFAAPGLRDFFEPASDGGSHWRKNENRWVLGGVGRDGRQAPDGTAWTDLKAWRDYLGTTDLVAAFAPHEAAFAEISRATLRLRAEIPVRDFFNDVDHDSLFQMGRLLAFRGRVRLEAELVDAAADDVLVLLRLGQRLNGATRISLLDALISQALTSEAVDIIRQGLTTRAWSSDRLKSYDVELGKLQQLRTLSRAYEIDVSTALVLLSEMALGRPPSVFIRQESWPVRVLLPNGWIWQNAVTFYHSRTDDLLPAIDITARRIDLRRVGEVDRRMSLLQWRPYGFGVSRLFANNRALLNGCVDTIERHDLLRIACRLERHRLDKGVYPSTLDELPEPPARDGLHDLRTGEPFAYSRRGAADGQSRRIGSVNGEHGFIDLR